MAIAFDASNSSTGLPDGSGVENLSLTVGSLTDGIIIGTLAWDSTAVLDAVPTFDGNTMTLIDSLEAFSNRNMHAWYYLNPSSGAQDFSIDVSSSATIVTLIAASYSGVDQTTPIGATNQGSVDNTTGNSFNLTTEQDNSQIVICANFESLIGNLTTPSGYTNREDRVGSVDSALSDRGTTTAGAYAAGYTHTAGLAQENVALAFELIESGAAPAAIAAQRLLRGLGR